ncbi:MAG TPA: hemolysin family protein [Actinomycetales bacterium]|nr:hemolysin family protein [Actinomycetales bacterium]
MLTEWLLVGLGVLLTLGTGVFVAAEFSLITVDRPSVERAAASGDRSARRVLGGLKTLSTQLSGAQVGITLTTLLVGFLVEPSVSRLLAGPLTATGLPEGAIAPSSVAVGIFLATVLSMLVGELIPKNLALSLPLRTARWSVPLQRAFTFSMSPLIALLNGTANWLLRLVGVEAAEELSSGRSPEELAALVRRSAEVGTLDEGTANLLSRTLGFSQHTAADVMTHRVRMESVRREDTASDVVRLARRTGYSRFPVTDEGLDDVVGVVHVKRAIAVPHDKRGDVPAAALMSEAPRVPETLRLDPLLVELRAQGLQMAVVTDEYGGTAGVVTLEDVVEELVGEVADEHDRARAGARRLRDGSWLLPGLMRPDEVRDRLDLDVPDGVSYETLAGFMMARLGRLAVVGDEVVVGGGTLRVERIEGRRVDRLRFLRHPASQASTPSAVAR